MVSVDISSSEANVHDAPIRDSKEGLKEKSVTDEWEAGDNRTGDLQGVEMAQSRKRWSLKRAAVYGLLFSLFMFGLRIWSGTEPSIVIEPPRSGLGIMISWAVYLGFPSLLFVVCAAIHNTVVPKEDDSTREWADADKKEFRRLMERPLVLRY